MPRSRKGIMDGAQIRYAMAKDEVGYGLLRGRPTKYTDEQVEAAIELEEGDLMINYFPERLSKKTGQ